MIAAIASFIGYNALIWWMKDLAGRSNAEEIEHRILTGNKKELDHKTLWMWRAIGIVTFALIACIVTRDWWALSLLLCGYGMMASGHRLTLNANRKPKLPWWHMDDLDEGGNWYDEFWWMVHTAFDDGRWITEVQPIGYWNKTRRQVARLAYGTEALSFITGASAFLIHFLR